MCPRSDSCPGTVYGHAGRAGTWWFDTVTASLDETTRARWFSDAFEIVSMAVLPAARGAGGGTELLRSCLRLVPGRTALLSIHRDHNPALRLYRREGFEIVHPGLRFSGSSPPYVVLARDLPGVRVKDGPPDAEPRA